MASDCKVWYMTKESHNRLVFGNVVDTKFVGDNESSYFQLFPEVNDHLGDVHRPWTARSGT